MRIGQRQRVQLVFGSTSFLIEAEPLFMCYHLSPRIVENPDEYIPLCLLTEPADFGLNEDFLVVLGSNEERMSLEIEFAVGDNEVDLTVESSTRIPSGIVGLSGICFYKQRVVGAEFQFLGDIGFKSQIAIVGTADTLPIEKDITDKHDATKIDQHPFVFPALIRHKIFSVPSDTHFLKSARGKPAFYVGGHIAVVRFLISARCDPRLTDEKIVWEVDLLSLVGEDGIIVLESPLHVGRHHYSLSSHRQR